MFRPRLPSRDLQTIATDVNGCGTFFDSNWQTQFPGDSPFDGLDYWTLLRFVAEAVLESDFNQHRMRRCEHVDVARVYAR